MIVEKIIKIISCTIANRSCSSIREILWPIIVILSLINFNIKSFKCYEIIFYSVNNMNMIKLMMKILIKFYINGIINDLLFFMHQTKLK